ncbi:unnamed protein product [Hyaloperonospora brassicae]|uniref:Uncharacterized protein n=1 Tax=Hyaloperonospora brassicae TaxID=162125 RepID=A0AAV0TES5_HYABA|nr:unnamed protein product [Hyaloperonospora brassicae]
MHMQKSLSKTERRRPTAGESASDSDVNAATERADDDRQSSGTATGTKRKTEENDRGAKTVSREMGRKKTKALRSAANATEQCGKTEPVGGPPAAHADERVLLAVETRHLDFAVAKWKQQQTLRRERLQLKRAEIQFKERVTKQQLQMQVMELRARLVKALEETGQSPAQAKKYLALLGQKEEGERRIA